VDVVLTLPSERYVAAVLNAEAAAGEPEQSLQALAIVARTYALNGKHSVAGSGPLGAELCDSTACQAMLPGPVPAAIEEAVQATAGETLWSGDARAEAFFSQSCGGETEDAGAVWAKLRGVTYLRSHADPYCLRRGAAAWHAEVPLSRLEEIARAEGWNLPVKIAKAEVVQRSASHRAVRIEFAGAEGRTGVVAASALRLGIGRALGWNLVRSDAYELGLRNGTLIFDGHGHGHGVGLCQQGAAEMAGEGKSAREILAFYFPGTAVRIQAGDSGWQETRAGAVLVRAADAVTVQRRQELQAAWSEAQRRFPPRHAPQVQIATAPSTELFRQMTAQPGWTLASTRGSKIVLQPDAVLPAGGRRSSRVLLHEMLHVLVESEATDRSPLWLREGLVEALAEDGAGAVHAPNDAMAASAIDAGLGHADSQRGSERAHAAAAAMVRRMIARYGLPAVRGWLVSGVPAGAV
jgi:stage II sporulation protein D